MNKNCHRSTWNETLNCWIATAENVTAKGKPSRSGNKLLAAILLGFASLSSVQASEECGAVQTDQSVICDSQTSGSVVYENQSISLNIVGTENVPNVLITSIGIIDYSGNAALALETQGPVTISSDSYGSLIQIQQEDAVSSNINILIGGETRLENLSNEQWRSHSAIEASHESYNPQNTTNSINIDLAEGASIKIASPDQALYKVNGIHAELTGVNNNGGITINNGASIDLEGMYITGISAIFAYLGGKSRNMRAEINNTGNIQMNIVSPYNSGYGNGIVVSATDIIIKHSGSIKGVETTSNDQNYTGIYANGHNADIEQSGSIEHVRKGIEFQSDGFANGVARITSSGKILTNEVDGAKGIYLSANHSEPLSHGIIELTEGAEIVNQGHFGIDDSGYGEAVKLNSAGVYVSSVKNVQIGTAGAIRSTYEHGVYVESRAPYISTEYIDEDERIASVVTTESNLKLNIKAGGEIQGGVDGAGIQTVTGTHNEIVIDQGASLGALSDLALNVSGYELKDEWWVYNSETSDWDPNEETHYISAAKTTLKNSGTMTGIIQLSSGQDEIINEPTGVWNVRHWAASAPGIERDVIAENAVSDFGGGNTHMINRGTIVLTSPLQNSGYTTTRAEFKNLPNFTHEGRLVLANQLAGGNRPVAGDQFVIDGHFVGAGGVIELDTNLMGDDAASDMLVVTGSASGNALLSIHNAGGTGAVTVGDGIKVVQVDGHSADNSFALNGPVQAGAYEYFLYKGGSSGAQDWYLRSDLLPATYSMGMPSMAHYAQAPKAVRPAVSGYLLGQAAMQELSFNMLGTLHKRQDDQQGVSLNEDANQTWGRMVYGSLKQDGETRFNFKQNSFYAEVGRDLAITHGQGDARQHTGVFGGLGTTDVDFSDRQRPIAGLSSHVGNMKGQLLMAGVYHTRYAPDGGYLDLVGGITYEHNQYKDIYGVSAKQNGYGAIVSAEIGKPWQIGNSNWLIEPQAQLTYQVRSYGKLTDGISDVSGTTSHSLRGRTGVRFAWDDTQAQNSSQKSSFYTSANFLYDLNGKNRIKVNGEEFSESSGQKGWIEFNVGGQIHLNKTTHLYGHAAYLRGLNSSARSGKALSIGIRKAW